MAKFRVKGTVCASSARNPAVASEAEFSEVVTAKDHAEAMDLVCDTMGEDIDWFELFDDKIDKGDVIVDEIFIDSVEEVVEEAD